MGAATDTTGMASAATAAIAPSPAQRGSPADANDTANTAATSTWLPPGANDPTSVRGGTISVAAGLLKCSISGAYEARRMRRTPSLPEHRHDPDHDIGPLD